MMLVANIKDFENCLKEIERFLPYIDNWATCDLPAPKCFAKNKEVLLEHIKEWIHSTHTYTIRYGMEMLMRFYLDEDFRPEYLKLVTDTTSDEYYVNMMIAWYPVSYTHLFDRIIMRDNKHCCSIFLIDLL